MLSFLLLLAFADFTLAQNATVKEVNGNVQFSPAGSTAWTPVKVGDQIPQGATIKSQAGGTAFL